MQVRRLHLFKERATYVRIDHMKTISKIILVTNNNGRKKYIMFALVCYRIQPPPSPPLTK